MDAVIGAGAGAIVTAIGAVIVGFMKARQEIVGHDRDKAVEEMEKIADMYKDERAEMKKQLDDCSKHSIECGEELAKISTRLELLEDRNPV